MTRDCFINCRRPNDTNITNTRTKIMPMRQALLFKYKWSKMLLSDTKVIVKQFDHILARIYKESINTIIVQLFPEL